MIRAALFAFLAMLLLPLQALCAEKYDPSGATPGKIRMLFAEKEVVVKLIDCPESRDFLSLLPLRLAFTDYVGKEKIAYLPRKLAPSGRPRKLAPSGRPAPGEVSGEISGDFAYYKPWGNLAVFYQGVGGGEPLAVLGRIESGKEALAAITGDFTARIEAVE